MPFFSEIAFELNEKRFSPQSGQVTVISFSSLSVISDAPFNNIKGFQRKFSFYM